MQLLKVGICIVGIDDEGFEPPTPRQVLNQPELIALIVGANMGLGLDLQVIFQNSRKLNKFFTNSIQMLVKSNC
jgi:hypothetical protein